MQNFIGNTSNTDISNLNKTLVLAGARGHFGNSIAQYLTKSGASLRALVRKGSIASTTLLKQQGVNKIWR